MKQIELRHYGYILLSALLFGSYGIWSTIIGDYGFGIFYQGWVRAAIILLLLTPIMLVTRSFRFIAREDWKWMSIYALFCIFTQAPLYYAFITTGIGISTLIFYALFIITSYVIGRLFLGERLTTAKLIALFVAFIGLAFTFGFSIAQFSLVGLGLAALNGIASGGEVSASKKLTKKYSSLFVSYVCWSVIFLTHLPLSILFGETQWVPTNNAAWAAMLVYAIAGLLGVWLAVEGFKKVDASIGSLVGLLEIIFGVICGILFFNEELRVPVIIGGGMILAAAMLPDTLVLIKHQKRRRANIPPREI